MKIYLKASCKQAKQYKIPSETPCHQQLNTHRKRYYRNNSDNYFGGWASMHIRFQFPCTEADFRFPDNSIL